MAIVEKRKCNMELQNFNISESLEDGNYDDWISIGGGNSVSEKDISNFFNQAQIDYLCQLTPYCLRGMLLTKVGHPYHFDCHLEDFQLWDDKYKKDFEALA